MDSAIEKRIIGNRNRTEVLMISYKKTLLFEEIVMHLFNFCYSFAFFLLMILYFGLLGYLLRILDAND